MTDAQLQKLLSQLRPALRRGADDGCRHEHLGLHDEARVAVDRSSQRAVILAAPNDHELDGERPGGNQGVVGPV